MVKKMFSEVVQLLVIFVIAPSAQNIAFVIIIVNILHPVRV